MSFFSSSSTTRSDMADAISARQARFDADISAAADLPSVAFSNIGCAPIDGDQMDIDNTITPTAAAAAEAPGLSNVTPPCNDCRDHISQVAPRTLGGGIPLCREGPENSPLLCEPCRNSYSQDNPNIPTSLPQRSDANGIQVSVPGMDINDTIRYLTNYADLLHNMIMGMRMRHFSNPGSLGVMPPEFDNWCHDETATRRLITRLQRLRG